MYSSSEPTLKNELLLLFSIVGHMILRLKGNTTKFDRNKCKLITSLFTATLIIYLFIVTLTLENICMRKNLVTD